ncbi:hypothetical protein IAD21_00539 [Abditibacteriota bacterium]|nr:hypothetical protein IAD21_00539 [Abditibacteriota bacterium]
MPAPIKVPYQAHFDFRALPSIRVMDSFSLGANAYAGVQNGVWLYDEWYWSERKGAWGGHDTPARQAVSELTILGGSLETHDYGFGDEPLVRVASGATLKAIGSILYGAAEDVPSLFRLYSCATGTLTAQADAGGALGVVADGSYILWSRYVSGPVVHTPYGDCQRFEGEWSAVRVRVGAGAWSLMAPICPSPGAALYKKSNNSDEVALTTGNDSTYRVVFDPLARSVSSSCKLDQGVRKNDGTFLIPAGTFLLGGLRASRNGPQTALWVLHTDGTSVLRGLQTDLSDGRCECGKTNHNAVEVAQSPDGTLYVLSECALFRFDPDALFINEALVGFPANTLPEPGHPGGNCLRFPGGAGEMVHWTEAFKTDTSNPVSDGTAHYNRMVRRVSGRDVSGPSTLWHGTNCAEMYLGRFWAVRSDDDETLYLDWLDNGRWHGYMGMSRDMTATFWQRLRAANGNLFLFGFNPGAALGPSAVHTDGSPLVDEEGELLDTTQDALEGAHSNADTPVCAIADGLKLREATFPFFIRRATVTSDGNLFLAARTGTTGIGPANRVVEILTENGGRSVICSFWNDTDKAFEMSKADFQALGGDVSKIPSYWTWQAMSDTNAGGKWKPSATLPTTGYWLTTNSGGAVIQFLAHGGVLPYDANLHWNLLCFSILSDGSIDTEFGPEIKPTCTDADCALHAMPDGTKFRVVQLPAFNASDPVSAIQLTDPSDNKRLSSARDVAPTCWMRIDSTSPINDLTTFTHLINFGRLVPLPQNAIGSIEVVLLVAPADAPLKASELPILSRRA